MRQKKKSENQAMQEFCFYRHLIIIIHKERFNFFVNKLPLHPLSEKKTNVKSRTVEKPRGKQQQPATE